MWWTPCYALMMLCSSIASHCHSNLAYLALTKATEGSSRRPRSFTVRRARPKTKLFDWNNNQQSVVRYDSKRAQRKDSLRQESKGCTGVSARRRGLRKVSGSIYCLDKEWSFALANSYCSKCCQLLLSPVTRHVWNVCTSAGVLFRHILC